MSNALERFVTTENIRRYKRLLKAETRPDRRAAIFELLERELAKLPEPRKRAEMAAFQ